MEIQKRLDKLADVPDFPGKDKLREVGTTFKTTYANIGYQVILTWRVYGYGHVGGGVYKETIEIVERSERPLIEYVIDLGNGAKLVTRAIYVDSDVEEWEW